MAEGGFKNHYHTQNQRRTQNVACFVMEVAQVEEQAALGRPMVCRQNGKIVYIAMPSEERRMMEENCLSGHHKQQGKARHCCLMPIQDTI